MTNKKTELKRLIIFLVLAFAISWIPAIIFNELFGYYEWFETNKYPVLFWIVGFGPAIANVLTRLITKEGWHDSMLHLNLKGNLKYYVFAIMASVVMGLTEGIVATMVYGDGNFSDIAGDLNAPQIVSEILLTLAVIPVMAFNTFGEEFGWRGYMNQKMEPLLGTTGTVFVGGIIWGLWHAELTIEGHNFGTEYDGYPWLGILCMCLFCTFFGMSLMWLTKKTGSVYPAAIMHAANNFGAKSIGLLLMSGVPEEFSLGIYQQLVMMLPTFLIHTVFFVWMLVDVRREKKAAKAVQPEQSD